MNSSPSPQPQPEPRASIPPHMVQETSFEEDMIGLQPVPEIVDQMDPREITRIAPNQWSQEVQEAMKPYCKARL